MSGKKPNKSQRNPLSSFLDSINIFNSLVNKKREQKASKSSTSIKSSFDSKSSKLDSKLGTLYSSSNSLASLEIQAYNTDTEIPELEVSNEKQRAIEADNTKNPETETSDAELQGISKINSKNNKVSKNKTSLKYNLRAPKKIINYRQRRTNKKKLRNENSDSANSGISDDNSAIYDVTYISDSNIISANTPLNRSSDQINTYEHNLITDLVSNIQFPFTNPKRKADYTLPNPNKRLKIDSVLFNGITDNLSESFDSSSEFFFLIKNKNIGTFAISSISNSEKSRFDTQPVEATLHNKKLNSKSASLDHLHENETIILGLNALPINASKNSNSNSNSNSKNNLIDVNYDLDLDTSKITSPINEEAILSIEKDPKSKTIFVEESFSENTCKSKSLKNNTEKSLPSSHSMPSLKRAMQKPLESISRSKGPLKSKCHELPSNKPKRTYKKSSITKLNEKNKGHRNRSELLKSFSLNLGGSYITDSVGAIGPNSNYHLEIKRALLRDENIKLSTMSKILNIQNSIIPRENGIDCYKCNDSANHRNSFSSHNIISTNHKLVDANTTNPINYIYNNNDSFMNHQGGVDNHLPSNLSENKSIDKNSKTLMIHNGPRKPNSTPENINIIRTKTIEPEAECFDTKKVTPSFYSPESNNNTDVKNITNNSFKPNHNYYGKIPIDSTSSFHLAGSSSSDDIERLQKPMPPFIIDNNMDITSTISTENLNSVESDSAIDKTIDQSTPDLYAPELESSNKTIVGSRSLIVSNVIKATSSPLPKKILSLPLRKTNNNQHILPKNHNLFNLSIFPTNAITENNLIKDQDSYIAIKPILLPPKNLSKALPKASDMGLEVLPQNSLNNYPDVNMFKSSSSHEPPVNTTYKHSLSGSINGEFTEIKSNLSQRQNTSFPHLNTLEDSHSVENTKTTASTFSRNPSMIRTNFDDFKARLSQINQNLNFNSESSSDEVDSPVSCSNSGSLYISEDDEFFNESFIQSQKNLSDPNTSITLSDFGGSNSIISYNKDRDLHSIKSYQNLNSSTLLIGKNKSEISVNHDRQEISNRFTPQSAINSDISLKSNKSHEPKTLLNKTKRLYKNVSTFADSRIFEIISSDDISEESSNSDTPLDFILTPNNTENNKINPSTNSSEGVENNEFNLAGTNTLSNPNINDDGNSIIDGQRTNKLDLVSSSVSLNEQQNPALSASATGFSVSPLENLYAEHADGLTQKFLCEINTSHPHELSLGISEALLVPTNINNNLIVNKINIIVHDEYLVNTITPKSLESSGLNPKSSNVESTSLQYRNDIPENEILKPNGIESKTPTAMSSLYTMKNLVPAILDNPINNHIKSHSFNESSLDGSLPIGPKSKSSPTLFNLSDYDTTLGKFDSCRPGTTFKSSEKTSIPNTSSINSEKTNSSILNNYSENILNNTIKSSIRSTSMANYDLCFEPFKELALSAKKDETLDGSLSLINQPNILCFIQNSNIDSKSDSIKIAKEVNRIEKSSSQTPKDSDFEDLETLEFQKNKRFLPQAPETTDAKKSSDPVTKTSETLDIFKFDHLDYKTNVTHSLENSDEPKSPNNKISEIPIISSFNQIELASSTIPKTGLIQGVDHDSLKVSVNKEPANVDVLDSKCSYLAVPSIKNPKSSHVINQNYIESAFVSSYYKCLNVIVGSQLSEDSHISNDFKKNPSLASESSSNCSIPASINSSLEPGSLESTHDLGILTSLSDVEEKTTDPTAEINTSNPPESKISLSSSQRLEKEFFEPSSFSNSHNQSSLSSPHIINDQSSNSSNMTFKMSNNDSILNISPSKIEESYQPITKNNSGSLDACTPKKPPQSKNQPIITNSTSRSSPVSNFGHYSDNEFFLDDSVRNISSPIREASPSYGASGTPLIKVSEIKIHAQKTNNSSEENIIPPYSSALPIYEKFSGLITANKLHSKVDPYSRSSIQSTSSRLDIPDTSTFGEDTVGLEIIEPLLKLPKKKSKNYLADHISEKTPNASQLDPVLNLEYSEPPTRGKRNYSSSHHYNISEDLNKNSNNIIKENIPSAIKIYDTKGLPISPIPRKNIKIFVEICKNLPEISYKFSYATPINKKVLGYFYRIEKFVAADDFSVLRLDCEHINRHNVSLTNSPNSIISANYTATSNLNPHHISPPSFSTPNQTSKKSFTSSPPLILPKTSKKVKLYDFNDDSAESNTNNDTPQDDIRSFFKLSPHISSSHYLNSTNENIKKPYNFALSNEFQCIFMLYKQKFPLIDNLDLASFLVQQFDPFVEKEELESLSFTAIFNKDFYQLRNKIDLIYSDPKYSSLISVIKEWIYLRSTEYFKLINNEIGLNVKSGSSNKNVNIIHPLSTITNELASHKTNTDIRNSKRYHFSEDKKSIKELFLNYDCVDWVKSSLLKLFKTHFRQNIDSDQKISQRYRNFLVYFQAINSISVWKMCNMPGLSNSNNVIYIKTLSEASTLSGKLLSSTNTQLIFNLEETGIYHRIHPVLSNANSQIEGNKQFKERVSLFLCMNSDGSYKLPLWVTGNKIISKAQESELLRIHGITYKYNKESQITCSIFMDWLNWFDEKMGEFLKSQEPSIPSRNPPLPERNVILILRDNFIHPLHFTGTLKNVKIISFSQEIPSGILPVESGVSRLFRCIYRSNTYKLALKYKNEKANSSSRFPRHKILTPKKSFKASVLAQNKLFKDNSKTVDIIPSIINFKAAMSLLSIVWKSYIPQDAISGCFGLFALSVDWMAPFQIKCISCFRKFESRSIVTLSNYLAQFNEPNTMDAQRALSIFKDELDIFQTQTAFSQVEMIEGDATSIFFTLDGKKIFKYDTKCDDMLVNNTFINTDPNKFKTYFNESTISQKTPKRRKKRANLSKT
ncbi:CENP-B-like protein [Smittium culicis]|uniref:CENP-B-like protein n=1 Tax=Smittium culicis TaxID=133412 RepID=A0A1R1YTI4_9FUNG|nr:CENP-B-like protein [Smittium culicis]